MNVALCKPFLQQSMDLSSGHLYDPKPPNISLACICCPIERTQLRLEIVGESFWTGAPSSMMDEFTEMP